MGLFVALVMGPCSLACTHMGVHAAQLHTAPAGSFRHAHHMPALLHPLTRQLQVGLLRRLLAAGACPIRALLPSLLRRYEGCAHSSALADKLRSGMKVVIEHSLPPDGLGKGTGGSSGTASAAPTAPAVAGDAGPAHSMPVGTAGPAASAGSAPAAEAEALASRHVLVRVHGCMFVAAAARQLLAAAVACRDEQRCCRLLGGLVVAQGRGNPWGADPEANCSLLVAAAAHDMPAVVHALLAVPPPVDGGQVGIEVLG